MHRIRPAQPRAAGVIASLATLVLFSAPAAAAPFASDGLESGSFEFSSNGFRWASPNRTSIVRSDGYVVNNGEPVNLGPFPDRQWENEPSSSGRHAMRFRYGAGAEMTEQRYSLGGSYNDVWISYWVRVPLNYSHQDTSRTADNNKWAAFWTGTYERDGATITMQSWPDGNGGTDLEAYITLDSGGTGSGGSFGVADGFMKPADRGRWMQVVYHLKKATGSGRNDGVFQMWRRWQGQSSFQQLVSQQNLNLWSSRVGSGFSAGYLFGWANSPYTQDTEFLLDSFTASTTSLVSGGSTAPEESPPKPPTDVRATQ